jgi:hypothetical protein
MEPNVDTNAGQEPSLRDSIAASIETLSEPPVVDKTPVVDKAPVVDKGGAPAKTAAEIKVKAHTRTVGPKEPVKEPAAGKEPVKITDTPPITTDKVAAAQRAPVSWKPDIREKWAALPPEVKSEVMRREHEVSRVLQESSEARKFVDAFAQTAAPYQHYIALEGNDPIKAFGDYLKTASLLRGGSPAEKANAVATAIHQYGVDVAMLDQALAQVLQGKPAPRLPDGPGQHQFRDPRLDELLGTLAQRQQQEEAALNEELATEVIEFAQNEANEFFEDVRPDISDLLSMAAARGQKMSLKEAYDKACLLNPEIAKIVSQRSDAAKAVEAKKLADAKRAAGGSITTGAPRQTGKTQQSEGSVRDSIEASIQQLQG